jgi:hypothetical protein
MFRAVTLAIVCAGFVSSGCVSGTSGTKQLEAGKVSQIKKGETTRAEVEAMFGPPDSVSMLPDGRRAMMYMAEQNHGDMSGTMTRSLIPFAAFFPSSDTHTLRRQSLQIYLNANSVVQDYEFSDNTSEIKTTASAFGAHTEQTKVVNTPPDASSK